MNLSSLNPEKDAKETDKENLLTEFENSDIFGQLSLKIAHPQKLKDVKWPLIMDQNAYEYSYNNNNQKCVYYYCRSKKSGCTKPTGLVDLEKKEVILFFSLKALTII